MQSSGKPKVLAFFEFAVITNELVEFLSLPNHFKHDKVSSVESDLDEKIYKFFCPLRGFNIELNSSLSGPDIK